MIYSNSAGRILERNVEQRMPFQSPARNVAAFMDSGQEWSRIDPD